MADCQRCGGACCESVTLDLATTNNDFLRFIELRSKPQKKADGTVARNFEVPCYAHVGGRCAIYDHRPQMCQDFVPGGPLCIATVMARRSAEEIVAILGESVAAPATPAEGAGT